MRGEIVLPGNEDIKYSYKLDISSLQKGTEEAVTLLQKQIDALTGVSNKTKSAEASARVFEKAWVNATNKVSKKSSEVSENVGKIAQGVVPSTTIAQNAFSKLSQNIDNMKTSARQAFTPVTEQLGAIARMIDPNISAKVQSFKAKAQKAFESVGGVLNQVSSAFRRTSDGTDANARSTQTLSQRLESLKNIYSRVSTASSKLNKVTNSVSSFFNKVSQKTRTFTSALKNATISTNLLRAALRILSAERIAEFLKEGIKQSISYVENLNLFTVAMGQSVEKGHEFVNTMQELYGMDPSNIMRQAGNFYQLATAIEMPDEAATQLSLTMTKAVNDISSLFNVPIETVFENLSSGLQGMSRAVRKYGMDIRTTTLQTEALALGITDQVESMSEANRIGLRFIAMMKQASNATGDFAANIETPANQLRIFKEQISQLGRAVGDFFVSPLRNALQYVNGFIMALRAMLTFIRKLLGIETDFQTRTEGLSNGLSDSADGISSIGNAASDTSKKLKGMLAPFDELNVLTQGAGSSSGSDFSLGSDIMDPRIAQAIGDIQYQFEAVEMKANKVRDALLEFFGFKFDGGNILSWDPTQFETNLINKFPAWTNIITTAFGSWGQSVENFKKVLESLWTDVIQPVATNVWITVEPIVAGIMQILSDLWNNILAPFALWFSETFGGVFTDLWQNVIGPLVSEIWDTISSVWNESLQPLLQEIFDTIKVIWDDLLGPLVNWIIQEVGPYIVDVIHAILPVIRTVLSVVSSVVSGVLEVIQGIVKFLKGVFTGDWETVWEGVSQIFTGIWTALKGIVTGVINFIFDCINTLIALVWPIIRDIGNAIGSVAGALGDLLGLDWGWTMPDEPPQIPHLAAGGVITDSTMALIGEAGRDEAVIPLDNSPQMRNLINEIAKAVNGGDRPNNSQPTIIKVFIGNEQLEEYIYNAQNRRALRTNGG